MSQWRKLPLYVLGYHWLGLWFIALEFQVISDTKSISDFIMLVYKISKTTTKIYFKIMIVKFTHQRVRFSV